MLCKLLCKGIQFTHSIHSGMFTKDGQLPVMSVRNFLPVVNCVSTVTSFPLLTKSPLIDFVQHKTLDWVNLSINVDPYIFHNTDHSLRAYWYL